MLGGSCWPAGGLFQSQIQEEGKEGKTEKQQIGARSTGCQGHSSRRLMGDAEDEGNMEKRGVVYRTRYRSARLKV